MNNVAILIPSLKKGGAEKQAALLARALMESGNNVLIIVSFPEVGYESENVELSTLDSDHIIGLRGGRIGKLYNLYRVLRDNCIDTLFCYLTWPDFYGVLIGRLAGVKKIYQGIRNAKLPKIKLLFEAVGNIFATGAIINNYSGDKVFKSWGIRNRIVIPNCFYKPSVKKMRERDDALIEIITVGRFVRQKDYPTAIESVAMAMQKDARLSFKIIGHGELESEVRDLVKHHGIENRTTILVNPAGIADHLDNADIYLSTSIFEGTSNSIMEAMNASLPVVATPVGDNERLVESEKTGFIVDCRNIQEISSKLLHLAASPQLRNEMGMTGNAKLHSDYSYEKFKERYLRLL